MLRVIWSHNTTVCIATNFTSCRLLFGAEAVLPEEIKHQSLHTTTPPCPTEAKDKDVLQSDRKGGNQFAEVSR
jgi:hypothetical protein